MGSPSKKVDNEGRDKISCMVCSKFYHRMDIHVTTKHGITIAEYKAKFPKAPIFSPSAQQSLGLDQGLTGVDLGFAGGDKSVLSFGVAELEIRSGHTTYDKQFIPMHDEHWEIGDLERANLEYLALAIQDDDNVLIVGPPGVGKSMLARELAAMCDQPLRRLSFNGEMRVADLVGSKEITVDEKSGQAVTTWRNGPLPDAIERGHWVVFEEFDSAPSSVTFMLHSALERPRQFTAMMKESGAQIDFHEHFRVIATANTLGYGDATGLYAGTAPMNEALLDRFGIVIAMDYPTADAEAKILVNRTGISPEVASKMVEMATAVREAQRKQQAMVSISTRRLVAWASKAERLKNVIRAARITFLNKVPPDDFKFMDGMVQRFFGSK